MRVYSKVVWDLESLRVVEATYTTYEGPVELLKQTKAQQQSDVTNVAKGQAGLQAGQQLSGQSQSLAGSTLLPAYQSILQSPGYSAADKGAITQATLGGLGAGYGAAEDTARRRLASTGNPAGFGATLDKLAQDRAAGTATAEAGLQGKFADTAMAQRNQALQGLSSLYGVDMSTMAHLLTPGGIAPKQGGFSFSAGIPGVAQVGYGA
jgi:hypothetical protein